MKDKIEIFTDGSAKNNPGRGGYGIVMRYGNKVKEYSEGFRRTTNNRMELLAVIKGLEKLKRYDIPVIVYSDSKYVIDSITKGWVFNWAKAGFRGKKNEDLWRRYLDLHSKFDIEYSWVKGHAGHIMNERCDVLATTATYSNIDTVYESL
jgi:ribonuclease HI